VTLALSYAQVTESVRGSEAGLTS